jgi:hypothetical protein
VGVCVGWRGCVGVSVVVGVCVRAWVCVCLGVCVGVCVFGCGCVCVWGRCVCVRERERGTFECLQCIVLCQEHRKVYVRLLQRTLKHPVNFSGNSFTGV